MSLQVWLPLTRDLRNQGIGSMSVITLTSGNELISGGKVGNKAIYLTKMQTILGTSSCMSSKKQMSYAFWVKVNTAWSTQWLDGIRWISTDGSTTHTSRQEFYTNCTNIGTWFSGSSLSGYTFTPEEWTHLAGTFDYTTGIAKFYINGVLKGTSTALSKTHYCRGDFYIGDSGVDIVENDVRIYDHCLSEKEVKELSKGLVLHYPLNRQGWGQENLYGYGADLQTALSGLNNYNNSFSITEEEDKKCAHVSGALTTTKYLQSKAAFTPEPMEQFTFSAEVKIKNIVRGTTNPMCEFYFSGATIDSAWRGFAVDYIHVDGVKVGATAIGFDRYLTDTAWHKVAVTAHFNYSGTSTIPALYPNIYMRDCTGDLYIRNVKLERGSIATPWCPNSSDALATTVGLNGTTEYDCSGFGNNGTKNNISYTSDTPKYAVSSIFNGSNSYIKVNDNNWMVKGMSEMTVNLWAKATTWPTNGGKLVSCTESGGFSLEAGNSGYWRFPIYVYTNSEQTSSAYKYDSNEIKIANLIPNEWNMITLVYETTGTKTYINGELHHTYTNTSYGINFNTNARLFLGCEASTANPSSPYFNGKECDFRIYATALSADDIKSLYNNNAYIDTAGKIYGEIR